MQVFVINLSRATERQRFQKAQLAALGLPFERVEAIDANSADLRNEEPIWSTWERPMSRSECACFLSHQQLWQRIARSETPGLVLEDDVLLSSDLPKLLDELEAAKGIDYLTMETRLRKKLLSKKMAYALPIRQLYLDRSGAAAYVLWPSGAQKLLSRTQDRVGLTDAVLCSSHELVAFQADPPLAIQADVAEVEHVRSPLETRSSVSRVSSNRRRRHLRFHFRRLRNQIAIGLRRLRYLMAGRHELLHVNPADFLYLEALSPTTINSQSTVDQYVDR